MMLHLPFMVGTESRIEVPSAFISYRNEQDPVFLHNHQGTKIEVPYINQYALQTGIA
ncbi:hypothetical protein SH601_14610 [Gracilibacillus sp. S3-1-1]|uniref:Uncharacterized protein n=1 Tax=Gracilibacillus pellucidus TaxID=3095368 RepID=A0ACC6M8X4_9BACI|nr:hypothetical protein [Gracilibacillus sp. S3-1-1]MDX8047217.1 hypothetical protein [Gracilibacillus sp. S3-1-1]